MGGSYDPSGWHEDYTEPQEYDWGIIQGDWTLTHRDKLSNGQHLEMMFYIDFDQALERKPWQPIDVEVGMGVLDEEYDFPYVNGTASGPGGLEVFPLAIAALLEGIDRAHRAWPDKRLRFVVHGATIALHSIYRRTLSRHGFWETEARPTDGQETIMVFQREES